MTNLKFRYLIVIILLAVTAFVVYNLQYESSQDDETGLAILQAIPMQIGKWKGQDVSLDETVYEILETKAIIHRNYINDDNNSVLLSIVHYHDTKVDFHAPEACLGGLGLSTTKSKKKLSVQGKKNKKISLEVAELLSKNNDRQLLSFYFYKSGNFLGQNYIKLRLMVATNRLAQQDSSGSLIRISTTLNKSKDDASHILQKFLKELVIHVDSY